MQITPVNFYTQSPLSFEGRGKPIDLKFAIENRAHLIPARVLEASHRILSRGGADSLKAIHLKTYAPLLQCTTLAQAKELFPEFHDIKETVVFSRPSVYSKDFEAKTAGKDFPLFMLQELWAKLKTKDESAKELGMSSRSSIEWALNQIGFVYYPKNYRALLKASDESGQKQMAQMVSDRNAQNPELMYERNRYAAQFCKTPEYRAAQSKRIIEHDRIHLERKEKISAANRAAWSLCPEIREALAKFAAQESSFCRGIMKKKTQGLMLTQVEARTVKGFYRRFWDAHPELKAVFSAAKKAAKDIKGDF